MHGCVDQRTTQDKASAELPLVVVGAHAACGTSRPTSKKKSLRPTGQEARRALKAASEPLLRSNCGQTAILVRKTGERKSKTPQFAGLIGARSAGLEPATFSVRSLTTYVLRCSLVSRSWLV